MENNEKAITGQKRRVLEWLQSGKTITPLDSWANIGVYRLAAIIHLLRNDKKRRWNIVTHLKMATNRFGEPCGPFAEYELKVKEELF